MATTQDPVHTQVIAPAEPSTPGGARRVPSLFLLLVLVVLVPLVLTVISLLGTHWHPSSDDALEVLRIRDVGGRHTPLTGVQSRFGWDHPGPLLFWLLAPFHWIAGDTGVLVGVACVNAAALIGVLLLARRRGGFTLALIVAVALMILSRALGTGLMLDPWNPWISLLPFFAFVLLAWSVAERDVAMLPWLAGVGSFLIETHVGYLPLVAGISVTAGALAFLRHPDEANREPAPDVRRFSLIALIVFVLAWLAPIIQQLTGHPGNLGDIINYFRHPTEKPLGIATGWGLMGRELGPPGPWIRGNDISVLGFTVPGSTIGALVLLAVIAALAALAWRKGTPNTARLAVLLIGAVGIGVIASARITGVPGSYLLRWWWVLAALLWSSVVWSLARTFDSARARHALGTVAGAAVVVLAIVTAAQGLPAQVPQPLFSSAIAKLTARSTPQLVKGRRYLMRWVDHDLGAVGVGMYLVLAQRGYTVRVPTDQSHPFGSWRTASDGQFDATLMVVAVDDYPGYQPPPGSQLIASLDPLEASDRQRVDQLVTEINARVGPAANFQPNDVDPVWGRGGVLAHGANPADVDALRRLRLRGREYDVFVIPAH